MLVPFRRSFPLPESVSAEVVNISVVQTVEELNNVEILNSTVIENCLCINM